MEGWSLALIAAVVVAYAAVSRRLHDSIVSPALFFTAAGLVFGTDALGWIELDVGGESIRLLAEATLTLVLFADASRIDLPALRREIGVPVRLLGIGLPLTIGLGALLAWPLLGALTAVEAVVLAVMLAPTDAALGKAVVTEPRLPSRIRQGLNVESGLNDGICVPLLLIALAVAETEEGAVTAGSAVTIVAEEIGYGVVGGVAAGAVGALVLREASRRRFVGRVWIQILTVGLAALAYGIAAPLGGSGFIAAFVGGLVFGWLRHDAGGDVDELLEESGELLNSVTFIVFGAVILGTALTSATWQTALYAVLSLSVVRMVPVVVAMLGTGARRPTVAFLGWFGPRGLASIVFAVIVVDEADLLHTNLILLATALTIGLSVLAHGVSAPLLTSRYVRWYEAHPRPPSMESVDVPEQRVRRHWRRQDAVPRP
jgi:NhaP-type Na+/H+ or K+/H+ antiporter